MARILVTGGCGFIGSNFIQLALARLPKCRLVNLDELTYAGNLKNLTAIEEDPRYRFVRGDIADHALVNKLFIEEQIDTVVHFAAESHVDRSISGPDAFIHTNILGTFHLLEACRVQWAAPGQNQIPAAGGCRFLHVSTDEVYGSLGPTGYFTEETPYAPNSPYSASKASSDLLARAYHHTYGLPALITNCSNNFGPYQFPEKLIPVVIQSVLERKPIPVYGDGMNVRDWLYVRDHAAALWCVLRRGRLGETYNIGAQNEWPNLRLVELICDLIDELAPSAGGNSKKLIRFVEDRLGHDRRYAIDSRKIRSELGWQPAHTFEQAMRETVQWYLEHQDWVRTVLGKGSG